MAGEPLAVDVAKYRQERVQEAERSFARARTAEERYKARRQYQVAQRAAEPYAKEQHG